MRKTSKFVEWRPPARSQMVVMSLEVKYAFTAVMANWPTMLSHPAHVSNQKGLMQLTCNMCTGEETEDLMHRHVV